MIPIGKFNAYARNEDDAAVIGRLLDEDEQAGMGMTMCLFVSSFPDGIPVVFVREDETPESIKMAQTIFDQVLRIRRGRA